MEECRVHSALGVPPLRNRVLGRGRMVQALGVLRSCIGLLYWSTLNSPQVRLGELRWPPRAWVQGRDVLSVSPGSYLWVVWTSIAWHKDVDVETCVVLLAVVGKSQSIPRSWAALQDFCVSFCRAMTLWPCRTAQDDPAVGDRAEKTWSCHHGFNQHHWYGVWATTSASSIWLSNLKHEKFLALAVLWFIRSTIYGSLRTTCARTAEMCPVTSVLIRQVTYMYWFSPASPSARWKEGLTRCHTCYANLEPDAPLYMNTHDRYLSWSTHRYPSWSVYPPQPCSTGIQWMMPTNRKRARRAVVPRRVIHVHATSDVRHNSRRGVTSNPCQLRLFNLRCLGELSCGQIMILFDIVHKSDVFCIIIAYVYALASHSSCRDCWIISY